MKKFDENYVLLKDMREDSYFPDFLVDQVKVLILNVVSYLETGVNDILAVQEKLDEMTLAINDLQETFEENDSEIETAARESIGETVAYVLQWFGIVIDTEDAIREREW